MSDSPSGGGFLFDLDTRVEKQDEDTYSALLTDRWTTFTTHPNGGYALATALNAVREALVHPDPLVVSAFFLRPTSPGPAVLRTEAVRTGRRTSTGQVLLEQQDREALRVTCTFGDLSSGQGRVLHLSQAPDLPDPQDCPSSNQVSLEGVSIAERVEYRYPERPGWLDGTPSGTPSTQFWMRFSDGRPADVFALPFLVDAAPPAVLEIGEFATTTVELTVHVRARPAPGWLACRVSTRHVAGGFHEEDFEIWDSAGTLVAQSRQLALLL